MFKRLIVGVISIATLLPLGIDTSASASPGPNITALPACGKTVDHGNHAKPALFPWQAGAKVCAAVGVEKFLQPAPGTERGPKQTPLFSGFSTYDQNITYIYGYIQVTPVSTPNYSTASEWVMTYNPNYDDDLAQAGWLQWGNGYSYCNPSPSSNTQYAWAEFDMETGYQNDLCDTGAVLSQGAAYWFLVWNDGNGTWVADVAYGSGWQQIGADNLDFGVPTARAEMFLEFHSVLEQNSQWPTMSGNSSVQNATLDDNGTGESWTSSIWTFEINSLSQQGYGTNVVTPYTNWYTSSPS